MTVGALTAAPPTASAPAAARPRRAHAVAVPLRRTGWVVFGLQFLVMAVWSYVQYSRFALTQDAANYIQAFHLISHGDLNPVSSVLGYAFISGHFQLTAWPLSLLDRLGPQGLMVLWAQDLFVVLAEAAAFAWMRHIVTSRAIRPGSVLTPNVVLGMGLLLLVADPWIYWAIAYDVHIESFALVFVVLAAFEFSRGNDRRAWLWVLITVLSGDVAATYVAGLGISALLAARFTSNEHRISYRTGLLLLGVAVMWTAVVTLIGGNKGSTLTATYGFLAVGVGAAVNPHLGFFHFLKGVAEHPANIPKALWRTRVNIYGNVAPAGWIGMFTAWTIGVPGLVLLENDLETRVRFSAPSYQSLPVYVFVPVGIVVILVWAAGRFRLPKGIGIAMVAVLTTNVILWAAIWIPQVAPNWLRVSATQAAVLSDALRQIPANAEVVVSQGVVGPFANRADVRSLEALGGRIPVNGTSVWFVLAPSAGIETIPVNQGLELVDQVASLLNAKLVAYGAGVWAFRWHRPPHVNTVQFRPELSTLAAWALSSAAGRVDLDGPGSSWHVSSSGSEGYLVYGDYWNEPTGHYVASAALSTTTPVNVEVWNTTSNHLIAQRTVSATNGRAAVVIPFDYSRSVPRPGSFAGIGPFRVRREAQPSSLDQLEIRVWTPKGGQSDIYTVGLAARR
jgi:hypothetical protein